ncbi:SUF system Fe-S cluster assembly regulator [Dichelobacter nodosus]|uniref:Rrf2 family protein n=1 Tax=Dichelobacter nodosus (strain VCS1703A) TaxID=246195 RepID=A5EYD8_DICNV|nr:SUF system Fe-S cluster assembly regulator [Dichelobacter nodosus]ABQ13434.1 Rrf2 family protein [Dichelobacter nodosus VCS1703A]AXM45644.1 SUF system Fe-S cluster assembly regulator [Dichelobacter nodosus]KNZ38878.1 Rrf2 family transcriptional regulator [Dichelobacter nodosus]TGA66880.1 SUF system Fe-S cluster assembly regulator [Dichelobacter nodosus]
MLRITKESEYAFLLLSVLLSEESAQSAAVLAKKTGIAAPMASKVLKRLLKGDIVQSVRGAYGGYRLAKAAETITALEVVAVIEGMPELVECVDQNKNCDLSSNCPISPFWQQMNQAIETMLAAKTLADMQRDENICSGRNS